MNPPCVENPESWVSDAPAERWAAMNVCLTVCKSQCGEAFAGCKPVDPDDAMGVIQGVDYGTDRSRPVRAEDFDIQGPTKDCQQCGRTFGRGNSSSHQSFADRKFCSLRCSGAASWASRRRAA